MSQLDWSDLRHALAVGQLGSVAAAARRLGVNATTVQRRLDALEAALGARLFDRSRTGWRPTEAGAAVLDQARRMADQAEMYYWASPVKFAAYAMRTGDLSHLMNVKNMVHRYASMLEDSGYE